MAESKLDILISARNAASGAIRQVSGDLRGLDNAADAAARGLSGLAAGAGIAGITALATGMLELGRSAAYVEMLGESFESVAGTVNASADEMLFALQRVSRGTISNADLMRSANRAMLLGVADSTEEMAALMEAALARGRALAISDAEAFERIVAGIGRESPLILDDLGIKDASSAFDIYAESIGTTADKLTDAERKQALFNYVLTETQPLIEAQAAAGETMADKYEAASASIDNLKDSFGGLVSEGLVPYLTIVTDVTNAFTTLSEAVKSDESGLLSYIGTYLRLVALPVTWPQEVAAGYTGLRGQLVGATAESEQAGYAAQALAAAEHEAKFGAEALATSLAMLSGEQVNAASAADIHAQALDVLNTAATMAERAIAGMASQRLGDLGAAGALGAQRQMTDELAAQVQLWQDMQFSPRQIAEVLIPGWVSQQREATREIGRSHTAVERVSKEYQMLQSAIQGVLSGALDPGVGVNPDDFLPRMDAVNEDARRLADIAVNGWKSPWVEYFRNEHPALFAEFFSGAMNGGDIQAQAAQLLKDFQDGLRPELIDRERAKEMVRRAIIGDVNMANLAQELARELATEMDVSLSTAQAAAQSTLGRGSGNGLSLGQSFGAGALEAVQSEAPGTQMVVALVGQLKSESNAGLVKQAGGRLGETWGAGFLEVVGSNVPPALIALLVSLVLPGVQSGIRTQQTQEGAQ